MQAFLQRVLNGGGRVVREYGLGRKRTDLYVEWPYPGGVQRVVFELKLRYGVLETTIDEGLAQTWRYMDKCGADTGHLLIFDRDATRSWAEPIFREERQYQGQTIKVWGM